MQGGVRSLVEGYILERSSPRGDTCRRSATWGGAQPGRGVQPGGVQPSRGTSQRASAMRGALEGPQRGSGAPTEARLPGRLPAWAPPTGGGVKGVCEISPGRGCARGPAAGVLRSPDTALPQTPLARLGDGRSQSRAKCRWRQQAGGGVGEGGDSSGLLQAALSDSWPRREDWQGRDFIVDRRGGGGKGGGCSLAATVAMGRGWRGRSSPPQRAPGSGSTPPTSPIPKETARAPWKQ